MKKFLLPVVLMAIFYQAKAQSFYCGPFKDTTNVNLSSKSNRTFRGLTFTPGTVPGIQLTNCSNIHITKCRFLHGSGVQGLGIYLNGSTNITIDSCYFEDVAAGIQAQSCTAPIKVNFNQAKNMRGVKSSTPYYLRGQFCQFNGVNGAGSYITNNKVDNVDYDMTGNTSPEDHISLYKSNGTAASPIMVTGNMLRGGGPSTTGSGITVGDNGGSYQVISNNTVVQTGNVGMQVAGGTFITMSNNTIYSDPTSISHLGLGCGNFTPTYPCNNITMSNNHVKWFSGKAADLAYYSPIPTSIRKDMSYSSTSPYNVPQPTGWTLNVSDNTLTPSILPTTLLTNCVSAPVLSFASSTYSFVYGFLITAFSPSNSGGDVVSYSISPSLPSGLTFNASTGQISGTPGNVSVSTDYAISGTNSAGTNTVHITIVVAKANLIIAAQPKNKSKNNANPALTYLYDGLVNGDTQTSTPPTITTTALLNSVPGSYDITVCCASDARYNITYQNSTLSVSGGSGPVIYGKIAIIVH